MNEPLTKEKTDNHECDDGDLYFPYYDVLSAVQLLKEKWRLTGKEDYTDVGLISNFLNDIDDCFPFILTSSENTEEDKQTPLGGR